jgi:hypothetical protein
MIQWGLEFQEEHEDEIPPRWAFVSDGENSLRFTINTPPPFSGSKGRTAVTAPGAGLRILAFSLAPLRT